VSDVPVGKRKQSKFEAEHHFYQLRDDITKLMLNDFGFDKDRYHKQIEKFREHRKDQPNIDEITARLERRSDAFAKWFIDKECDAVLEILRTIQTEFSVGNSIHPTGEAGFEEWKERRLRMDRAIGGCFALKQEMQYIIRTLPVDINKFESYSNRIDKQIALYRGTRQADNRFLSGLPLNVANAYNFANANGNGNCNANNASNSNGVRPDFRGEKSKPVKSAGSKMKGKAVPSVETDKHKPGNGREIATSPGAMPSVTT
jgi:hypothetical protein